MEFGEETKSLLCSFIFKYHILLNNKYLSGQRKFIQKKDEEEGREKKDGERKKGEEDQRDPFRVFLINQLILNRIFRFSPNFRSA